MSHKLLDQSLELNEAKKRTKTFHLPNFNGKIGFSVFTGKKEVFLGVSIGEVEIEQTVKRRFIKTPKAGVKVFKFDSV